MRTSGSLSGSVSAKFNRLIFLGETNGLPAHDRSRSTVTSTAAAGSKSAIEDRFNRLEADMSHNLRLRIISTR
jgi:hypothetical protein